MNCRQIITRVWLTGIVALVADVGVAEAIEKNADVAESPQLTVTLQPALANGFTTWEGYSNPGITYEIDVMSGNSVVQTISTSKNYYKFDQVTYRNHAFRVKAIDSNSHEVIGVGPQDRITVNLQGPITKNVVDPVLKKTTCTKICNGPDYAWKMELMQDDTPSWSINSPAYLALRPLYESFDTAPGATNSTWQAMTPAFFSANSWHYINYNYAYVQVILPATPSASSPQIVDAYGTTMNGATYFVQKKMEQFKYAENNISTTFNPGATICSGGITSSGGWISKFNAYPDATNALPSGVNDAPTLSCTNSPGGYSSPGGNEPGQIGNATAQPSTFYFCNIDGLGSFMSLVPCDTYATGNDGPPVFGGVWIGGTYYGPPTDYLYSFQDLDLPNIVDHIEFDPLSNKGRNVIIGGDEDAFAGANADFSSLKSGIYQLTVFMKGGRGFPRYVEIVNNTSAGAFRD
jgi:hypothetical protein